MLNVKGKNSTLKTAHLKESMTVIKSKKRKALAVEI
jgi:hypothetical protein